MEPEIYFYKFLPENGYGYAEVGDTVYKVHHNDATCMAHGVTHSQATAPGYAEYYIWAIRLRDNDPMVTTVVLNTPGWLKRTPSISRRSERGGNSGNVIGALFAQVQKIARMQASFCPKAARGQDAGRGRLPGT